MAKKSAWKEHESCSPGLVEGRYARLSNSQMLHPKMRKLGANALKLYLYMKLESGGKTVFEFPITVYTRYMTKRTFLRAKDELVEAGFIELDEDNSHNKLANKYRFSTRWKEGRKPL